MNSSPAMFTDLPVVIQPIISNGLITGVVISILLERFVRWRAYEIENI
ncbi:hypothetical protein [Bacillus sp. M6-12]|nr:hypothetical protein [Bacillus sp. M6-12]